MMLIEVLLHIAVVMTWIK